MVIQNYIRHAIYLLLLLTVNEGQAQQVVSPRYDQDPTLNNLVHIKDYVPSQLGSLQEIIRKGKGKQDMILVAGSGFSADIFATFMASRVKDYRMFAITIPGFGGTMAPPMPTVGTSYGEQTWTMGVVNGVERLIKDENISNPIIITHLQISTQVGVTLALNNKYKTKALIMIAPQIKFESPNPKASPNPKNLIERIKLVDNIYAPKWFKTVTRDTWDDNNYLPGDYARHPLRALQLWRQAAEAPLPVLIRYLCEFNAQNISGRLQNIKVPTLILKPDFDDDLYIPDGRPYMEAFFHWALNEINPRENKLIRVESIKNSRMFIMDDQLEKLNSKINSFIATIN